MARPDAKRPFCPDPSVTLQVLRLRRTRFEDEVGIAVECTLIEPQSRSPARWDQYRKTPVAAAMPNKTRPSHFHDIKVDRFRIADYSPGMSETQGDSIQEGATAAQ